MKCLMLLFTSILGVTIVSSQELLENANEKFNNQDWIGAAKMYTKYLKKNDRDSAAWFGLGMSQFNLEDYESAVASLNDAKQRKYNKHAVDINIAKAWIKNGSIEEMYNSLESAAEEGLITYSRLTLDEEFEAVRASDRFQKIIHKVELNAYPCLSDEKARHFDFWIGEWDVYVGTQKVGENSITRSQGGCAIHENYVTTRNYAGQSINFYSPVDEKWHQHWVGSSGDVYNYVEIDRKEGMLQFLSDFKNPFNGNLSLSRLTFRRNEDGTVTQLFENSTDGGENWSSSFNGLYKKRK